MLIVLFACLLQACSQKVCPAYESFFLLDSAYQAKTFSYFADSLPRTDLQKAYKNRYGIGDEPFIASVINKIPPPIRSPFAKINTIEPVVIYPELPDSLEFAGDELMAAEMDIPDSTAFEEDSLEVSKNWHFNIDQENYFNYILKRLEIPIEPVENEEGDEDIDEGMEGETLEADSTNQDGKKRGGLKGLFKRKNKKDGEETEEETSDSDPDKNQDTEEKQNN